MAKGDDYAFLIPILGIFLAPKHIRKYLQKRNIRIGLNNGRLVDFNGISTRQGVFYALNNHSMFIFGVIVSK